MDHSEFPALAAAWKRDVATMSFVAEMVAHPAYQAIIAMGKPAVGLILAELEREPNFWFAALEAITGENPVRDVAGMPDAVGAWLEWGRRAGAITTLALTGDAQQPPPTEAPHPYHPETVLDATQGAGNA